MAGSEEQIVWRGTAHSWMSVTLLVAAAVMQLLLLGDGGVPLAARIIIAAVLVVIAGVFGKATVTVTPVAIDVALGFAVKSLRALPLTTVTDVKVIHINPLRYGGWGYRWCGPRCTAITVRRGEGLEILGKDGRRKIVTVDDAEAGAAAIRSLIST